MCIRDSLVAEANYAKGEIRGSGELEEVRFFALSALHAQPLAKITSMILDEFAGWLALSPQGRPRRKLISIQGRDNRLPEKAQIRSDDSV